MNSSQKAILSIVGLLVVLVVAYSATTLQAQPSQATTATPHQPAAPQYTSQAIGNSGFIVTNTSTGFTTYFSVNPDGVVIKRSTVSP